jgi:hypothetical protein
MEALGFRLAAGEDGENDPNRRVKVSGAQNSNLLAAAMSWRRLRLRPTYPSTQFSVKLKSVSVFQISINDFLSVYMPIQLYNVKRFFLFTMGMHIQD